MWDLVGNPEDRFSQNEAQIVLASASRVSILKLVTVADHTTVLCIISCQKPRRHIFSLLGLDKTKVIVLTLLVYLSFGKIGTHDGITNSYDRRDFWG